MYLDKSQDPGSEASFGYEYALLTLFLKGRRSSELGMFSTSPRKLPVDRQECFLENCPLSLVWLIDLGSITNHSIYDLVHSSPWICIIDLRLAGEGGKTARRLTSKTPLHPARINFTT